MSGETQILLPQLHLGVMLKICGQIRRVQDVFWEKHAGTRVPCGKIAVQTCGCKDLCLENEHLVLIDQPALPKNLTFCITDLDAMKKQNATVSTARTLGATGRWIKI